MPALSSGKILQENTDVNEVDFIKTSASLCKQNFTGYAAICIKGASGLEEGTFLFDQGKIAGCFYEYYALKKEFYGKDAFQRILNASASKNGLFDIISITPDQVRLALAVNQKIMFAATAEQFQLAGAREFSPLFEQQASTATLRQ